MFLSMPVPYNVAVETLSAYGKIGFMICHFTSVPRNNFLYIEYQFEKYSTWAEFPFNSGIPHIMFYLSV